MPIFVVDCGGSFTKFYRGGVAEYDGHALEEYKSLDKGSPEEILDFFKTRMPPGCRRIVLALPAFFVRGRRSRRIAESTTKFRRLASFHEGELAQIESDWSEALGCKFTIHHDGETAGLGELYRKTVTDNETAYVLTLGTSIGSSLLSSGQLIAGPYSYRVSHLVLAPSVDFCAGEAHSGVCPKMSFGLKALERLALWRGLPADLKAVKERGELGDPAALAFYDEAGSRIARVLAAIASVVPLDAFVLGGGVSRAGGLLLGPIKEHFTSGVVINEEVARCVEIRASECKNAVIEGGIYIAKGKWSCQCHT